MPIRRKNPSSRRRISPQTRIRPPKGNWNWLGWETDPITAGQLQAFYGKIPNYLQSDREGLEKERNHLQTLIDMELLQLEAKEQGIDRLPAFIYKIAQYRKEKLVGLYQIKKIRVRVSGQEVSDYFREQGLGAQGPLCPTHHHQRRQRLVRTARDQLGA